MRNNSPKIVIWMNIPSVHQSDFIEALQKESVDFFVLYYEKENLDRESQGLGRVNIGNRERFILNIEEINNLVPDWKNRWHIIPGIGDKFSRKLILFILKNRLEWIHWSEHPKSHLNIIWELISKLKSPIRYLYSQLIKRYSRGALAISTLSKINLIKNGVNEDKIFILNYSVCSLVENKEKKIKNSNRVINFLYVGRIHESKGIYFLLDSIEELNKKGYNANYLIVGKDYTNGYFRLEVNKRKLQNNIQILGVINRQFLGDIYQQSDVLILPSRDEGWGVVLNEAASVGMPLIVTNRVGGGYHLVENGLNGFVIEYGNKNSLANAMRIYIEDNELIKIHGAHSKKIFNYFSPVETAKKLKIYLQVMMITKKIK